jgi:hypothetical protein
LVCVVLGVFGAIRNWTMHTEETAIARDGALVEGRVTRKWLADDSEAGNDYMIGYSFDLPSGQRIEAQHEIDAARYRALSQGDSIAVQYAREPPHVSLPQGAGATSRRSAGLGSTISALIALFGVALLVRPWLGQNRLGD